MIHQIETRDDPRIAPYARVGDHAWLTSAGLFVAEGRLVVDRLIAGSFDVHSVLVTPAALEALRGRLAPLAADVYVAPQSLLNEVTGVNFHRGCLALARRPEPPPLQRFFAARRLLLLEGVGNPDNIGGLFRVAAALGADGIVLDPRSADPLYRKAIRTSMGAVLRVPFARMTDWPRGLRGFADGGFRLLALTPEPSARLLSDIISATDRETPVALLLGAEGTGLTQETLATANERGRIPMAPGVDSLNVVIAAAIALYALS